MRILKNIEVDIENRLLVEKLEENKAKFQGEYETAMKLWQDLVLKELENLTRKHSRGEIKFDHELNLNIRRPINRTSEYDQAIRLFKASMSSDEGVITKTKITKEQYDCIVEDQWDWRLDANAITAHLNDRFSNYQ